MKIAFITELPFLGKTNRNHLNMRTEFAWFVALDADNIHLTQTHTISDKQYDLAIIIIPKQLEQYDHLPIMTELKRIANKTAFMQEGPSRFYHELPLQLSFFMFEIMNSVDFVFAHNDCDKMYYEGLLNKPTFINPTLMIEDSINGLPVPNRKGVMVGGNFGRWYGGFDSYIVANVFETDITFPSMGRMAKEESSIKGISHLPYLLWKEWIMALNNFKYAVHLIPMTIGGTFSLNCAYLGIPCIGNERSNTQRLCFPDLSVDVHNVGKARSFAKQLKNEPSFYDDISKKAKNNYKTHFSLDVYQSKWEEIKEKVK